jgi:imidazolonepropionase-like amidohydrolase
MAPAFAPDGRHIAYLASDSSGVWRVAVGELRADAQPQVVASDNDIAATRVRWTPDGSTIVYAAAGALRRVSSRGGTPTTIPFEARLPVVRAASELPPVRFPAPGEFQRARGFTGLALSPDARRIAVLALGKLWVAAVGGDAHPVVDVPHTARYVAWSPDGLELVWSAGPFGQLDIFATEIASGRTRRVTAIAGSELYPAFSPDGRWLAFTHVDSTAQLRLIPTHAPTVDAVSGTRDVAVVEPSWVGSDVATAQWSPRADALLLPTAWTMDRKPIGEVVRLTGERATVKVPDGANFLRWTRDGLVWARHDRLWRASFDSMGVSSTIRALGDAPAMYPSVSSEGSVLYVSEGGLRIRSAAGGERDLGWPVSYTVPVAPPLVIRNVRVIDGTGSPASAPIDLEIERGRISRIGAAGSADTAGRRVLEADGRYAIPGLMDLHAHTEVPDLLPGFLYFGVTLVRDQGSAMAPLVAYADMIAAGTLPGPRVSYGGFQFYTDWPADEEQGRGIEPESDPAHVRRSVALAQAFGAQHLKIRTFRRWDITARIIAEAHRRGLRTTGHCVQQLPLIDAGMDAKEHLGYCGTRYATHALREDVVGVMGAARIDVVPTLSYISLAGDVDQWMARFDADTALAPFLPERSNFGWMLRLTPADRAEWQRDMRQARATVSRLARAGLTIGTGSDIWQIPVGVHMELEELVASGLAPLEAIRAATLSSARIVGVQGDLGSIEAGKLADIVLLDADPLADIRNTRRIVAVIKSGQVIDRTAIRQAHAVEW